MKYLCVLISFAAMFWNVENFFDYFDSGQNSSDTEFSPLGEKHWTKKKFLAKSEAIAKTIFFVGDSYGRLPDIVAFAEIENGFVLRHLISETGLRKCGYKYVHYESSDHRGIDVGLIYNPSSLELISSQAIKIPVEATRDILLACFKDSYGDSLAVLVNHFPSKYGGAESGDGRLLAARSLLAVCDSLASRGFRRLLALGDFNESPGEAASQEIASRLRPLKPSSDSAAGTIKFNGLWERIDQAFASESLPCSMDIPSIPYLLVKDPAHSGLKPLRTYSGPRYLGGISDHLPILVTLDTRD